MCPDRRGGDSRDFQFHWLSENKMKKYKQTDKMYCVMRDGVSLEEIYEVDTKKILKAMEQNSTNNKSIHGHAGFSLKKLKENLSKNLLNKISLLLSYNAVKKFRNQLDPRKYNGAILLGLNGPVVKSHGSTDARGLAYSINLCNKIVKGNLIEKIKKNLSN